MEKLEAVTQPQMDTQEQADTQPQPVPQPQLPTKELSHSAKCYSEGNAQSGSS